MAKEIERKFLVAGDGWRKHADGGRPFRQAYLAETERAVVRVRIEGATQSWLTIKSAESGLSRQEFEYPIPVADAEDLVRLCAGSVLEKTRFRVSHRGSDWEVDVYSGDNEGLTIAEIELPSEQAEVERPGWVGDEVTGDRRYYAASLSVAPFCQWTNTGEGVR